MVRLWDGLLAKALGFESYDSADYIYVMDNVEMLPSSTTLYHRCKSPSGMTAFSGRVEAIERKGCQDIDMDLKYTRKSFYS